MSFHSNDVTPRRVHRFLIQVGYDKNVLLMS